MTSPTPFENGFALDANDSGGLSGYMHRRGWLAESERIVATERAGDGNMNCTVRVRTSSRTLILKQARPWVEKYPHIAAPWDRACMEAQFYQTIASQPVLSAKMPRLLGFDANARLLMLEDLEDAKDLTTLYQSDRLSSHELQDLVTYLVELHYSFTGMERRDRFANAEMRTLNHQHLFQLPLDPDNGIGLDAITPGLAQAATTLLSDTRYRATVKSLGERYLSEGPCLLHGDYFPGSWLRAPSGIKIIDPEFCFFGPPEFDVGVLLAHLYLAAQPEHLCAEAVALYHSATPLDVRLMRQFAGVEIMRRLIGVAQLPFRQNLQDKARLLALSKSWVLQ
ncbi:phosphotransferase [Nitrospira sp. Nam74]